MRLDRNSHAHLDLGGAGDANQAGLQDEIAKRELLKPTADAAGPAISP